MTRGLVATYCIVILTLLPCLTHAQQPAPTQQAPAAQQAPPQEAAPQFYPENTPQACSDRFDNDGDGYIDCYDADCKYFNFCAPTQQPAPAQPYYVPQVSSNTATPVSSQPPSTGVGAIVTGFIFLPLGIALALGSIPLWQEANVGGSTRYVSGVPVSSGVNGPYLAGAVVMVLFGTLFTILGAVLIPSGFSSMAKYNRWKKAQQQQQQGMIQLIPGKLALSPELGGGPSGGTAGLRLTF